VGYIARPAPYALSIALLATTTLQIAGCCIHRLALPASLDVAAKSYRARRDLESLQALIGGLRIGMPEWEVIALLGKPDYCPIEGQCYYSSDKQDHQGFPITLVVEFRYTSYRDDDIDTVETHRLESYSLFGVGE
jgi:hypothetical protein